MSACLTRPVRLVRERELGDLGVVARPRERTQAGGRPTCGMTLRIKLYRGDRGPSPDTTDALPRAADELGADAADAENHAAIPTLHGGAVLERLNENFAQCRKAC